MDDDRGRSDSLLARTNFGISSEMSQLADLDVAPIACFVVDDRGNYLEVNPAACRLTGYSRDELCSMSVADLTVTPGRPDLSTLRRLQQESHVQTEIALRRKDGSTVSALLDAVAVDASRFLAVCFDITRRRSAEANLATLFEISQDLLCVADINTATFVRINPAFERILGWSEEELLGRPFLEFVHPEDREPTLSVVERRLRRGVKVMRFINRYQCRDGTYRWMDWNSHPIPEQGVTFAIARDITQQRLAEKELSDSEVRFHELFNNMRDGVAVYEAVDDGEDFIVRDLNRSGARHSETTPEQVVGKRVTEAFPGVKAFGLFELLQRVYRTGEPEALPARRYRDDRLEGLFENYVYRLPSGEIVAVFDNVTERERAVRERLELADQLRQAQKMEAVGRLAGGIAHDFNNLLTGIVGNLSLASMGLPADDPTAELLREAQIATDRATQLTRQLLTLSRKQPITPEVVDVNEVLRAMVSMLQRVIGEDVRLSLTTEPDLPLLRADRGQLEQVILNLAVNARDAMPQGGRLRIKTSTAELDEARCRQYAEAIPGPYLCVEVADSGHGIEPGHLETIFDPFFTTKPVGKGTGLGLSTVLGIVQQHRGVVGVESTVEQGTTFQVFLPITDDVERGGRVAPSRGDRESAVTGATVLVVEDEVVVRSMVERVLRRAGYVVLTASQGDEAMHWVERYKDQIDLLLTDVVMPSMNGRELAGRLVAENPELKVLFMSGYAEEVMVHHGVDLEGVHFIAKPFDPDELVEKVGEVLRA